MAVAVVVVAIVADIVVIDVDIAAVADNSNRVGAIVLYIVKDPVVDSIGMGVPVVAGSIDIGFVATEDSRVDRAKHAVAEVLEDRWYKVGGVV
jgi:hypothetical protein